VVRALPGNLRDLGGWIAGVDDVDAVVLAAADFQPDAGAIGSAMLEALLFRLGSDPGHRTLIYTGGCWLYGATGDRVATEDSPRSRPLPGCGRSITCSGYWARPMCVAS
jgi:hypothetical protein